MKYLEKSFSVYLGGNDNYDKIFGERKICKFCINFWLDTNRQKGMCLDCINYSNYRKEYIK